jgi:hypothetical protein
MFGGFKVPTWNLPSSKDMLMGSFGTLDSAPRSPYKVEAFGLSFLILPAVDLCRNFALAGRMTAITDKLPVTEKFLSA